MRTLIQKAVDNEIRLRRMETELARILSDEVGEVRDYLKRARKDARSTRRKTGLSREVLDLILKEAFKEEEIKNTSLPGGVQDHVSDKFSEDLPEGKDVEGVAVRIVVGHLLKQTKTNAQRRPETEEERCRLEELKEDERKKAEALRECIDRYSIVDGSPSSTKKERENASKIMQKARRAYEKASILSYKTRIEIVYAREKSIK